MHPDAHLARPGVDLGHVDEPENLGSAMLHETDCTHPHRPSWIEKVQRIPSVAGEKG
jgi:hypothetical protein